MRARFKLDSYLKTRSEDLAPNLQVKHTRRLRFGDAIVLGIFSLENVPNYSFQSDKYLLVASYRELDFRHLYPNRLRFTVTDGG